MLKNLWGPQQFYHLEPRNEGDKPTPELIGSELLAGMVGEHSSYLCPGDANAFYSILFATETTPMIAGALPPKAAQAPPSGLLTQASGACRTRSCAQLHLQPPANYEKEKDDAALAKQVRLARALGKRFPRECTRHLVTERRNSLPPWNAQNYSSMRAHLYRPHTPAQRARAPRVQTRPHPRNSTSHR